MSTKNFIIAFCVIMLLGIISTATLYFYTAKLQKEASIINIVANER